MATTALSERLPTEDEARKASVAISALAKSFTDEGSLSLKVSDDGGEIRVELPPAVGQLMLDLLMHIARREMVTLVPYEAELTTQKAADLLNVSRPFLVKLIDAGEIKCRLVGSHRRVRAEDLLAYKERRDGERTRALKELQRLGQEYDAG